MESRGRGQQQQHAGVGGSPLHEGARLVVNQWPVCLFVLLCPWMPGGADAEEIADCRAQDCGLAERHGTLGPSTKEHHVDGYEESSSANAGASCE